MIQSSVISPTYTTSTASEAKPPAATAFGGQDRAGVASTTVQTSPPGHSKQATPVHAQQGAELRPDEQVVNRRRPSSIAEQVALKGLLQHIHPENLQVNDKFYLERVEIFIKVFFANPDKQF